MDEKNVAENSANADIHGSPISSGPPLAVPPSGAADYAELPISSLLPADSPRLAGEDEEHIRLLAECDDDLPPILVHRETMQVIDGMHRVRAAVLRGEDRINARLFEGSADAAFVAAVEANIMHGLPLSLAEREAAAARIVAMFPFWSDRSIAGATGISARTVAGIRRRVNPDAPQPGSRVGRDGRVRPVNGAEGRRRAGELLQRRPDASLREVARAAGISPGTAQDVRARMRRGESPLLPEPTAAPGSRAADGPQGHPRRGVVLRRMGALRDRATILRRLRRDPAVRFTDSGRGLIRWLDRHAVGLEGWENVAPTVPPHCGYVIADLACAVAEEWLEFADCMRRRTEESEQVSG